MVRQASLKTALAVIGILSLAVQHAGSCGGGAQADMLFIMDESGSVGHSNFQAMKGFVRDMVDSFTISSTEIRVGVQKYSSGAGKYFNLNDYYDKAAMKTSIMAMSYNGGGTNTAGALKYCRETMLTSGAGDRANVPNIVIVITDGRSWSASETGKEARNLRNTGATIFSVGIGNNIPLSELNDMATDPDSDHVFAVSGFSALAGIQSAFQAQACPPTNGNWGGWGGWGGCTKTCGSGSKSRARSCNNPAPANGGTTCAGSSSENAACNTQTCIVHGAWSSWSSYGTCSVTCGAGTQQRTRSCTNPAPVNGGTPCSGVTSENQACTQPACSSCSGNVQADIVFVLDASGSVGASNFVTMKTFMRDLVQEFDIGANLVRVGVELFSSSPSTKFHLNGHNYDKTTIQNAIDNIVYTGGGTSTGTALSYLKNTMFTAANGDRAGVRNIGVVLTDGRSNNYADTVLQAANARNNGITIFAIGIGSGIPLGELQEMATDPDSDYVFTVSTFAGLSAITTAFQNVACVDPPAINGAFTAWAAWGTCSTTCELGTVTRARTCTNPPPANGGANCTGLTSETADCNLRPCPVDGVWSTWQAWSACSVTCMGVGVRGRIRGCDNPPSAHGGASCPGAGDETETCDRRLTLCDPGNGWAVSVYSTTPGTPVDGGFGSWSSWSTCTVTCGAGMRLRQRVCNSPVPRYGGLLCAGLFLEKELCGNTACPGGNGYVQTCPERFFDCKSGNTTCVHFLKKCDCSPDCDDASDEDPDWGGCIASNAVCQNSAGLVAPQAVTMLAAIFLSVAALVSLLWRPTFA